MERFNRCTALLLCVLLLFGSLSGCQVPHPDQPLQSGASESSGDQSLSDVYTNAAEHLRACDSLTVETSVKEEHTVGNDTLEEESTGTVSYQNLSMEHPIILSKSLFVYGLFRVACDLLWSDGIVYASIKEARYLSRLPYQDFIDEMLLPVSLLTPSNYSHVSEAEGEIVFSDAETAESWAMPTDGELLAASGSALIREGVLVSEQYDITFLYGGTTIHKTYEVRYTESVEEDLSALIPENVKEYESLDSVQAAICLLRGRMALESAEIISTQTVCTVASGELGFAFLESKREAEYMFLTDYRTRSTVDDTFYDFSSEEDAQTSHVESRYANGEYTVSYDGEAPTASTYTTMEMKNYMAYWRTALVPEYKDLVDARMTDVGAYYLIEFSLTDEYKELAHEIANFKVGGSYDAIAKYSTKRIDLSAEGCMAIEKCSFLPTSLYLTYKGVYTVQGEQAYLQMSVCEAISLYDPDTYEQINDEPLPDETPETPATPLFYEVTGENGERMYLFGTIHVGDDRTGCLPQNIYDALHASDALAVEFDDVAFAEALQEDEALMEQVAENYCFTDGTTIQNHVDSELYRAASCLLKVAGSYTNQADYYKPYVWSSEIERFYLSQGRKLTSSKGVDRRLMALARQAEQEILNVESGESQLALLSSYSDAVQQMLLVESVATSRNAYLQGVYQLYELWCAGDEQGIRERIAAMSDEDREKIDPEDLAIYDEYHQKMEVARNEAMLETAKEYLESGRTIFFAVGLVHLLGDGGLIPALSEAGYTVTQIKAQ